MGENGKGAVLVIGTSGLVGGALAKAFAANGYAVTGTFATRAVPDAVQLDVRHRRAVHELIDATKPDVVCVAINVPGGVDRCEVEPADAHATFVDATEYITDAARKAGSRIVLYSTDYVFDGRAGPYSETDAPSPLSAYARAKLRSEEIVRAVPHHLVIRTTWVFGWDRASKNFAMQLWERAASNQPLHVPSDQWGNPTLAEYLAEVSVRLVQLDAEGVINVVGKDRVSRDDFARALARSMAVREDLIVPVPTEKLGQKASRPLNGGLRTDLLQSMLGTEALDLAESLKRFRRQWRADTYVGVRSSGPGNEAAEVKATILDQVRDYYAAAHRRSDFVPFKSRINYAGRVYGAEELVNLVDSALDFWLTLGPYGDVFESGLKKFLGAREAVLVSSGSTANLTATMALMSKRFADRLEPGDEVITPAVTFPTTLAPLVHGGLVPVFVDVAPGTYNVNPDLLEDAIGPRTRAMMLPHTLGNPVDLARVTELCRRKRLLLIEDSCDALGSRYDRRPVGTFGDLATISFFPAHHITMGEGGAVIVNNPQLVRIVRSVRDWGRDCWCAPGESNSCGRRFGWELGDLPRGYDHKFVYTDIGYNFKPTDLQAAVGVAQLRRLPEFIAARKRNFCRFYEALKRLEDRLLLPVWDPRADPAWFGFPITARDAREAAPLIQHLETANIETRKIFGGNILKQPAYREIRHRVHGSLVETDRVMEASFFIGVYPGLTETMIDFVIDRFDDFFRRH